MPRILLTAFEPYHEWPENSSWLALMELTRWFDSRGQIVTRRYPTDLVEMTHRLGDDLTAGYDYAIHLGQAPGTAAIKLEMIALNAISAENPLVAGAPVAYRTALPMARWAQRLSSEGIPAIVSHHAGTHVCNALSYFSQHLAEQRGLPTRCGLVHLPLAPQQVAQRSGDHPPLASMSLPMMAAALTMILSELLGVEAA